MDNSDLEGLEIYQLYELMEPLALAEPVSMAPQGPGWWVLAGVIVSTLCVLAGLHYYRRYKNRYRYYAIAEIEALDADYSPLEVSAILKRCLMSHVARQEIASLTGQAWCDYLNACVQGTGKQSVQFKDFYRLRHEAFDREQLRNEAKHWLMCYRVAA